MNHLDQFCKLDQTINLTDLTQIIDLFINHFVIQTFFWWTFQGKAIQSAPICSDHHTSYHRAIKKHFYDAFCCLFWKLFFNAMLKKWPAQTLKCMYSTETSHEHIVKEVMYFLFSVILYLSLKSFFLTVHVFCNAAYSRMSNSSESF